jgi:hypothetical protein
MPFMQMRALLFSMCLLAMVTEPAAVIYYIMLSLLFLDMRGFHHIYVIFCLPKCHACRNGGCEGALGPGWKPERSLWMLHYIFALSHSASTLWRKVIAFYRSRLMETIIAFYSYCSGLIGNIFTFYSYGSDNMMKAITYNGVTF